MDAANTFIETALVHADEDAVMRQQIVEIVRKMVEVELQALLMQGRFDALVSDTLRGMEYEIKRMALRALKEHFNNPQMIY